MNFQSLQKWVFAAVFFAGFHSASGWAQEVFDLSKNEPEQARLGLGLEATSNQNSALLFQVNYSGVDGFDGRFRLFMVRFVGGPLNPADLGSSPMQIDLKIYPISRQAEIDELPVGIHALSTEFKTDLVLGLNSLASIRLIGASTRFNVSAIRGMYVALSAEVLGAYLFRNYSQERIGSEVQDVGFSPMYYDVATDVGMNFGNDGDGAPLVRVTLMGIRYSQGTDIDLGEIYGEASYSLQRKTSFYLKYGRRWINDSRAHLNNAFIDKIELGIRQGL